MKSPIAVFAVVLAMSACAPDVDPTRCGDKQCTVGQRCEMSSRLCVLDEPPTLTLNALSETVSTESFVITGTVADDVGIKKVECSVDGTTWVAATFTDTTFTCPVAAAPLDSAPMMVKARVTEKSFGTEGHEQSATAEHAYVVDRVGPVSSKVSPTAVVGGATVLASASSSDGCGEVSSLKMSLGGVAVEATLGSVAWVATLDLPQDFDQQPVTITFTATDRFGNQGISMAPLQVDTKGPAFTLTAPSDATVGGASAELVVTGVDSQPGIHDVKLKWATAEAPMTAGMGNTFSAMVDLTGTTSGLHMFTVTGIDALGNTATSHLAVTVDEDGPVLNVAAPTANQAVSGTRLAVSGTVTDANTVATVTVTATAGGSAQAATLAGNAWSIDVPLSNTEDRVMHTAQVSAKDRFSNETVISRTYFADNVAPRVSLTSPHAMDRLGGPQQSTVVVSLTAFDGVDNLGPINSVTVNGVAAMLTSGHYEAMVPLPMVDFSDFTITAVATDAAGNSGSASIVTKVDRVAPVVAAVAPAMDARFNIADLASTANKVNVSWTLTEADPGAVTEAAIGTGSYASATSPLSVSTSPTDNPASYTVVVRATDRAGNVGSATFHYSVDRVAPSLTSWNVGVDQRNVDGPASATFSEPVFGATTASQAFSLTPNPPNGNTSGTWNTMHTVFTSSVLSAYTVYSAQTAAGLSDAYGNPVPSRSVRFATAPFVPPSGTTLLTGVAAFDVTSDEDGVAILAWQPSSGSVQNSIARISPTAGTVNPTFLTWLGTTNHPFTVQVKAYRSINSDLTANSTVGASGIEQMGTKTPPFSVYQNNQNSAVKTGSNAVLVTPPMDHENATAAIGYFNRQTYSRGPNSSVDLAGTSMAGPELTSSSLLRWDAIRTTAGSGSYSIEIQDYAWRTGIVGSAFEFRGTTLNVPFQLQLPDPTAFSIATTNDGACLALTYPSTTAQMMYLLPHSTGMAMATNAATQAGLRLSSFSVAGSHGFVGAWNTGSQWVVGTVAVQAGTCAPTLTASGAGLPVSSVKGSLSQPVHPVQLGNRAALLYIDTADNLKVFYP